MNTEKIATINYELEIKRLREEIILLNQRMSSMSIEVTSSNSEWEKLYSTYQILLEDIKKQVDKNEQLAAMILEFESLLEKYNSSATGSESYLKQQLEILDRSSIKNQSIFYISRRKDNTETKSELHNLRQKI